MKPKISSLQAEVKALKKQHEKQRSKLESFLVEFFLCYAQSTAFVEFPQYYDCTTTIALQRALGNEVPKWDPEEGDWQLPIIIEQYNHAKVAPYLPV